MRSFTKLTYVEMTGAYLKGLFLALVISIHRFDHSVAASDVTDIEYCYQSLTTLTTDAGPDANCFAVLPGGTISRVFKGEPRYDGHVYPGLWDGHGHLLQYGELLRSVDLFGSENLQNALDRVKIYASAHADSGTAQQWLRGVGWDQAAFGRMPTAVQTTDPSQLNFC